MIMDLEARSRGQLEGGTNPHLSGGAEENKEISIEYL
jgi:hypothetical protein